MLREKLSISFLIVSFLTFTASHADITTIPPTLNPGDEYRLAFITKDKIFTATSPNIADYDGWVTAQANMAPDLVALNTTWQVIGSTTSVAAKDHTSTDDSPAGANGVPIFRLDGALIASNYDDLWDGSIQNPLYVAQDGTVLDTCCGTWTGTDTTGVAVPGSELGAVDLSVTDGAPNGTGTNWIQTNPFSANSPQFLYAISDILIVPADSTVIDTLEDIGPDGTAVTTRSVAGITVTISTALSAPLNAATYFDSTPNAFQGVRFVNDPLVPGNVSGSRFISTVDRNVTPNRAFGQVAPIIFDFSSPVRQFGLTTIDLLEDGSTSQTLTLRAFDESNNVVDEQTRTEPQGPSGIDLDWRVESTGDDIVRVELLGNIPDGVGGYGIDDLTLRVASILEVDIDAKPGGDPECRGSIPVAVLGSDSLDVTQIDPSTLSFEELAVRVRGNGMPSCSIEDVNDDGYSDLICQYRDDTNEGMLTGELLDGTPIEGVDTICVIH